MRKKALSSKGYTLIEFVMVMIVVSVIGVIIMSILSSTLRGTKKTNVISSIRTSGNQAITQMAKLIRFAKKFEGVSKNGTINTYVLDCTQTVIGLTPTPTPVAYKYLKFKAEDDGQIIFTCDDANSTIASNTASLIDTDIVKVADNNCWFTCNQDRVTTNPVIRVYFELRQAGDSAFPESQFSIAFETSVVLKNLVK